MSYMKHPDLYDVSVKDIEGREVTMGNFRGKMLLIVNTASRCGFTPQYEGLNALHKKYSSRSFEVLGFPCNQFGGQEPGSEAEIKSFCDLNYQVEFPMFSKIEVNGANEHPLYSILKDQAPGFLGSKAIKWNFTKFLVSPGGKVLKRFAPAYKPESIAKELERRLPAAEQAETRSVPCC
jgi:glutathione peroxidase